MWYHKAREDKKGAGRQGVDKLDECRTEKCVLDFSVAGDLSRSYFIPDINSVLSTCVICVHAC